MDFDLSKPQKMLKSSARDFLARECTSERVRSLMESETAFDSALWQAMADQGWTGLIVPETFGGLDLGFVELAAVCEEMGRACLPGPFLSNLLATAFLVRSGGGDRNAAELQAIAAGERRATVALLEEAASWNTDSIAMRASRERGAIALSGRKLFVPDAETADSVLCVARSADALLIVPVGRGAAGLSMTRMASMDETRKLYALDFDGVTAAEKDVLAAGAGAEAALRWAIDAATVAICAEMVGSMQWILEATVEYAKTRQQFGRAIGSFQAVQHHCADMLLLTESARSSAYYAAWTLTEAPETAPLAVSIAKSYCSDAVREVANRGIQVHGGIGFTWEHDLQLYFKRAKSAETLFGDATFHRERVARLVMDEARSNAGIPESAAMAAG